MIRTGIITGIEKEVAILRKTAKISHEDIACAGASTDRAYKLADKLSQNGCKILISFGVAGALDPTLKPGDLIIPNRVIDSSGSAFEIKQSAIISHFENFFTVRGGPVFGSEIIIAKTSDKNELYQLTGAIAVDMESLGVAKAARAHGLPFFVIRAIADTADQDIPLTALEAIDDQGKLRSGKITFNLARNLRDLPRLIKLAGNSRKAFASLSRVAALGFDF